MLHEVKVEWYGYPGHFCLRHECQFHLCTRVGSYLLSTLGARRNPQNGPMKSLGYGPDHLFEVQVFRVGPPCSKPDCQCAMPLIDGHSLYEERFQLAGDAQQRHYEVLRFLQHREATGEPVEWMIPEEVNQFLRSSSVAAL